MIKLFQISKELIKLLIGKTITPASFKKLVRIALNIKKTNKRYEYLINKYDRYLETPNYVKAQFLGKGSGSGSMDYYRKIETIENIFFEKIYFRGTIEHKKIIYFFENIFEKLISEDMKIPRISNIVHGNQLDIFYYDFVESENIANNKHFDFCCSIDSKLKDLSIMKMSSDLVSFQLFTEEALYKLCRERIFQQYSSPEKLSNLKFFFEKFEERLIRKPMIFQHGDLRLENIFENQFIIDWDKSTFYPENYDLGYIMADKFHLMNEKADNNYSVEELLTSYCPTIKNDLNLLFFISIFLVREKPNYDVSALLDKLISKTQYIND